jgi:hypothetical protein
MVTLRENGVIQARTEIPTCPALGMRQILGLPVATEVEARVRDARIHTLYPIHINTRIITRRIRIVGLVHRVVPRILIRMVYYIRTHTPILMLRDRRVICMSFIIMDQAQQGMAVLLVGMVPELLRLRQGEIIHMMKVPQDPVGVATEQELRIHQDQPWIGKRS